MEKLIKEINPSTHELKITLSSSELDTYYQQAYKKAQSSINLKGFRKGKVPINMIKKMYGEGIEADANQEIAKDEFNKIRQEDNLKVIGTPSLTNIEKIDTGIEFTIQYETIPKITIKDIKGITIKEPIHIVTDEEIQDEINNLLSQHGEFETAEQVTDNNFVLGLLINELDNEGNLIKSEKEQLTHVYLSDKNVYPELKENLLNTKLEDSFEFSPSQNNDTQKRYNVVVKEIQRLIPKEFNNEFVESITNGKLKTTEEFREELEFNIQDEWDRKAREFIEGQIIDKVVSDNEVSVPESLVKQVMQQMLEDYKKRNSNNPEVEKATVESLESELRPMAEKSVKWEILRNEIVEKEDITVEEHDLDPIIEQQAKAYGIEKEQMKKLLVNNPGMINSVINKKVIDFILDFAITEEVDFETGEPLNN